MASQGHGEGHGHQVRVKMYVLDGDLKETAAEIKQELTSELQIKVHEKMELITSIISVKQSATQVRTQGSMMLGDSCEQNDNGEIKLSIKSESCETNFIDILSFEDLKPTEAVHESTNSNTVDCDGSQANFAKEDTESHQVLNTDSGVNSQLSDSDCTLSPNVVIILGHSNIYKFGPFCTAYILKRILHPFPPAIVAFLGCCGGGVRHGPLFEAAQRPEWKHTFFGFFQRRVYIDELCKTNLVQGIRNYLHFVKVLVEAPLSKECTQRLVRYSFACVESGKYNMKLMDYNDPTMYANDFNYPDTTQQLLEVCYNIFKSGDDVRQNIPLPCLQLALYHRFFAEHIAIADFIHRMQEKYEDTNKDPDLKIEEMEEECIKELERSRIQKIVELADKVQLLPVLNETIEYLKEGKWKELDHLQFFVAILQGYWGENPFYLIRIWAKYHLVEILKKVDAEFKLQLKEVNYWDSHESNVPHVDNENDIIYEYHLCCVAFCLFSKYDHIIFPAVNNKYSSLTFCIWSCAGSTISNPYVLVPFGCCFKLDGLIGPLFEIQLAALPRDKVELPWQELFYKHEKNEMFSKMFNDQTPDGHVLLRNSRLSAEIYYKYTLKDLKIMFSALTHYLYKPDTPSEIVQSYHIEPFCNINTLGKMMCFEFPHKYQYAEMRVIRDFEYLERIPDNKRTELQKNQLADWRKVKRCRFVFAYHERRKHKMMCGFLFLTDSHYGWDEVSDEVVNKQALKRLKRNGPKVLLKVLEECKKGQFPKNVLCKVVAMSTKWKMGEKVPPELLEIVEGIDFYDKLKLLNKDDIRVVQQCRIDEISSSLNMDDKTKKLKPFPFELVGRLRITENNNWFDFEYCDNLLDYIYN